MAKAGRSQHILGIYFALSALCSLLALIWILAVPSEAGSVSLLGYSWGRLGFALLTAGAALFFLYMAIRFSRPSSAQLLTSSLIRFLDTGNAAPWAGIVALLGYLIGVIFLFTSLPIMGGPYYPPRLLPVATWLCALNLFNLLLLSVLVDDARLPRLSHLLVLLVILLASVLVNINLWDFSTPAQEDIYSTYIEGDRLLRGVNPYERVLDGDMRVNRKYATYFPIFYYLSWWSQAAGLREFTAWLSLWRVVFLIFNLLIAALLFYLPDRKGIAALALLAVLFWSFNRWTLHVARTFDLDFLPVYFMLLSLHLFKRNKLASYLLLGLSLGIKQMGIFLVPVYLIWTWQESGRHARRNLMVAILAISSIPLITSLPFMGWNLVGFLKSITFSASRDPAAVFEAYSLDALLGVSGMYSKIPMLVLMALVYWLVWTGKTGRYLPALLVMAVFVFFNSVLFTSYMVWIVPLILLTAYQILPYQTPNVELVS